MSAPLKIQADKLARVLRTVSVPSTRSRSGFRYLGPAQHALLVHYAWRANAKKGHSYWSVTKIAAELGVCERQVQRLTRDLETVLGIELQLGGGRLKGCHRTRDGHFAGRANVVIPTLDRVTPGSRFEHPVSHAQRVTPESLETRVKGDTHVTDAQQQRVTPVSDRNEISFVKGNREMNENATRVASPAGSAQESVGPARLGPTRQAADAAAPLRSAPSGDGSPSRADTRGVVFADAKTVQGTEHDAWCFSCKRPVTYQGAGHAPDCREPKGVEVPKRFLAKWAGEASAAAWREAFGDTGQRRRSGRRRERP